MPIEGMIAEGDRVAVYLIFEGTHTCIPFLGVPATENRVRFSSMMLLRIADGKIIEKISHSRCARHSAATYHKLLTRPVLGSCFLC